MVGCAVMVISYAIIGGLADGFPTETKFNRIAAGFQVAFIYVIQMVCVLLSFVGGTQG